MDRLYYTGIGSRSTPIEFWPIFNKIALELDSLGYTLRSGGAAGADSFFEHSHEARPQKIKKEIWLPSKGFNCSSSNFIVKPEAFTFAAKYHPAWHRLSEFSKKLIARNGHQVLGEDLKTPSKFILCWTEDGKTKGGTGQALRIAEAYDIPVHNFGCGNLDWKWVLKV